MNELELVKLAENPDPRAPCLLLLDTSASMAGKPIAALNEGLRIFYQDLMRDELARRRVEVALLGFGYEGLKVHDFVTVDDWSPVVLQAGGATPMGEAIDRGLDLLQARKAMYKAAGLAYYRPWVFLLSDGEPTDPWQEAAKRIQEEDQQKGLLFFVVGVEGANLNKLAQIASVARPPLKLKGLNFAELFLWLSQSQQRVSQSRIGEQLALPPIGWAEVDT